MFSLPSNCGISVTVEGERATVTLDRPEVRNAMHPTMWSALATIGRNLPASVRFVVLLGNGKSFCAGLDRRLLAGQSVGGDESFAGLFDLDADEFDRTLGSYQEGFRWLRDPRFISIAAVHGHAIGGGFQLALACDLRVLAEDAVLCMKEAALGMLPDLTGSKNLVDIVGYSRALEITATARLIGASEAQQLGLANEVVRRDELRSAVDRLIELLGQNGAGVVRRSKRLYLGANERTFDEQCVWERTLQFGRIQEARRERDQSANGQGPTVPAGQDDGQLFRPLG